MGDGNARTIITYPPKLFKLKVDENTGLNVTVSWEKPKCNIQSYQIRCVDEDGELSTGETDSSIPQYTKRNLIPGCRYDIEVAAVNDSGIGPYSEILTFNAAPSTPCNVEVCTITESSVSVKFDHKDPKQQEFRVVMTCLSNGENTTKVTKGLVAYIEALEPGEVYLMMVYAIHEELTSIPSKPVRVETYPAKVKNVQMQQSTCNSQTISWDSVYGASSYFIHLHTYVLSKRDGMVYEELTSKYNKIVLQNLKLGQFYTVSIAAVNKAGQGQYSDPVDFHTVLQPPSNISIKNDNQNPESSLTCSFVPMNLVNCKFDVKILDVVAGTPQEDIVTTECYAKFNDLQPGGSYKVSVQAIHVEDASKNSSRAYSKVISTYCSQVKELKGKRLSKSSWVISWKEVHGATDYAVKYESNDSSCVEENVSNTEIILKELTLGKTYTLKVTAINNAGQGKESETFNFKTDLAAPESVDLENPESRPESSIKVQITEHETRPAQYKIMMKATDDKFEIISYHIDTSVIINDLKPGTQYIAQVCSCDLEDKDRMSEITSSKPIWTCPSKVQNPAVTIESISSRKFSWEPVVGATSYEIKWKKSTDKKYEVQNTETVTGTSLADLDLNTNYTAWITAVNSAGHGEPSAVIMFQTGLHPPSNVEVKNSELDKQTSIEVKFTEPEQRANKYGIRVVHKDGKFKDITQVTGYNWATIRGLECGECYRVYVCSIHEKDEKLNSTEISSELIRTVLGKLKVTTTQISATRQKLEWSEQSGAKEYLAKYGIKNSEEKELHSKQRDCILENLSPGQNYVASVAAVNDSGIGEYSDIVNFTTVPSTPQNLQHKLISTDETLLTCDSCHGATNYIFNITSDGNQIDERITTLQQYRFKYKGNCTKFQVQIKAQNSAGSSGYSQPLEFKQILQHSHNKVLKQAKHDLVEGNFIPPSISEIPSSRSKRFEDFIPPRNSGEVVMLFGDQFYGKTAACSYYIQKDQSGNLMIMMDYDKLRHSAEKMDVQTMLHKYMTDLTPSEMGIIYQWMKENSGQVSFVIDNASLPQDFHEKQCSYEDKEDISVLLYNITRRHRDIFPESQVFCTTSQDNIQGILKPTRAATITGFNENHIVEMEKQIFGDKDIPDMPLHVRELCSIPSFCKIIIQLVERNTAKVDLSSVAAVLVEVLSRILSSNSADVNEAKLTQLFNRISEFLDKVNRKKISHGQVQTKRGRKARRSETIDEAASSVYTQRTAIGGEDDYTDIVGETYLKALYTALQMEDSEFEQFFSEKKKLDISRHSKMWIMTAGLLRSDTAEKITKVFKSVFPISAKNVGKKKRILKKFITDNKIAIQNQVYQNNEITVAWLMCCAELQDEDLQRKCSIEIKIKNDLTQPAQQQICRFVENLPMSICRMVQLNIKQNIFPAISTQIDEARRQNPHGEMIRIESYKKTNSIFSRRTSSTVKGVSVVPSSRNAMNAGNDTANYQSQQQRTGQETSNTNILLNDKESKLIVSLPDNYRDAEYNGEYRFIAISLLDGAKFNSSLTKETAAVIENINPGDNYEVIARQVLGGKVLASTQIKTYKTITNAGGEVKAGDCSIQFQEGTFTDTAKISISHVSGPDPPGYSPISSIYNLHSTNDVFHKEMSCTLRTFCETKNGVVFTYAGDAGNEKWEQVNSAKQQKNKIEFQCEQLGVFAVFLKTEEAGKLKLQQPRPMEALKNTTTDDPQLTVKQGEWTSS